MDSDHLLDQLNAESQEALGFLLDKMDLPREDGLLLLGMVAMMMLNEINEHAGDKEWMESFHSIAPDTAAVGLLGYHACRNDMPLKASKLFNDLGCYPDEENES